MFIRLINNRLPGIIKSRFESVPHTAEARTFLIGRFHRSSDHHLFCRHERKQKISRGEISESAALRLAEGTDAELLFESSNTEPYIYNNGNGKGRKFRKRGLGSSALSAKASRRAFVRHRRFTRVGSRFSCCGRSRGARFERNRGRHAGWGGEVHTLVEGSRRRLEIFLLLSR